MCRDVPHLEMRACNGFGQLVEERLLNLGKLIRIHYFEDILDLIKVHNFFSTVDLRPISQQSEDDLILFNQSDPCQYELRILTSSVRAASFSKNWTIQYANCGWYMLRPLTLCIGRRTRVRNSLCSSFNGRAKPLIIEPRISRSSAMPLNLSVS